MKTKPLLTKGLLKSYHIFYQHKDIKVTTETLYCELKKVNLWLQATKLSLNIKKTSIIFKTRRKRIGDIIVKINDTEINCGINQIFRNT